MLIWARLGFARQRLYITPERRQAFFRPPQSVTRRRGAHEPHGCKQSSDCSFSRRRRGRGHLSEPLDARKRRHGQDNPGYWGESRRLEFSRTACAPEDPEVDRRAKSARLSIPEVDARASARLPLSLPYDHAHMPPLWHLTDYHPPRSPAPVLLLV